MGSSLIVFNLSLCVYLAWTVPWRVVNLEGFVRYNFYSVIWKLG